jgi:hypothetical protein
MLFIVKGNAMIAEWSARAPTTHEVVCSVYANIFHVVQMLFVRWNSN